MAKARRASDSEFWIAVQRLWTFEEPLSRWIRLRKNLTKLAPNSMSLASRSICEQELLFAAAYGVNAEIAADSGRGALAHEVKTKSAQSSIHFSLVFAVAELQKFQERSFAFCAEADAPRCELSDEIEALVKFVVEHRALTPLQERYLRHRVRSSPDWCRLLSDGPWAADSRTQFVRDVLSMTGMQNESGITDDALYLLMESEFHKQERNCRNKLPPGFLPKRIVLVEGVTEQILLPHFAKCVSRNWDERAILVVPAGGAKQVARRYTGFRELIALPMDCLLDGDVLSQAEALSAQMKDGDRLYVLTGGAIEEVFPREQIIELANAYFDGLGGAIYSPISLQDLNSATNQESLDRLWRKRNRGSFDKIGFAKVVAEKVTKPSEIPTEIRQLIADLCAYE